MFWGLDTMATNAYLIYSDIEDLPPISHKEFRLQCAWGLILAGPSLETRSRDAAPKPAKKVNIKSDTALPLDCSGPGHMPIHLLLGKKLACWLCRWKRRGDGKGSKDAPKTRWSCGRCDLPLCLFEDRNCFLELHVS